jgi:hypothetical protein
MSPSIPAEVRSAARTLLYLQKGTKNDPHNDYLDAIQAVTTLYNSGYFTSFVPALPVLLRLKGKPYSLANHFPMEPLFSFSSAKSLLVKAGRQVSKSVSLAARQCILASVIPYFSSLYVAPRFEQARRFSNNYVKPFLTNTPLGEFALDKDMEQSVLQRSFINGSLLHFSFAFLDAERVRGVSADTLSLDEVQDIDIDFLPVLLETMSASDYRYRVYAGTPKTLDNTIEGLWEDSSQAEWATPCTGCRTWNIASIKEGLLDMIQPKGMCCKKCGKLLDPSTGNWIHMFPDKRSKFEGYHTPQVIFPMHYANPERWSELISAKDNWAQAKYWNEKLGESCDIRANMLTRTDLQKASVLPYDNTISGAVKVRNNYVMITVGTDWGGGGEEGVSHTAVSVLGHRPDGKIDVLYIARITNTNDPVEEIKHIINIFQRVNGKILAHDFCGAGALRETMLIQAGFPVTQIFPAHYTFSSSAPMVEYRPPSEASSRHFYSIDKSRSLVLICQLIKHGVIRFPKYETWEHVSKDFMALVEDRRERPGGSDIYVITRKAKEPDDCAHAVNYGCLAFWHSQRNYPDLAAHLGIRAVAPPAHYSQGPMDVDV